MLPGEFPPELRPFMTGLDVGQCKCRGARAGELTGAGDERSTGSHVIAKGISPLLAERYLAGGDEYGIRFADVGVMRRGDDDVEDVPEHAVHERLADRAGRLVLRLGGGI